PGAVVTGVAHGRHDTCRRRGPASRRAGPPGHSAQAPSTTAPRPRRSGNGASTAPLDGAARRGRSAAALLADPHTDDDRGAGELEVLPQPSLDEAAVAVLEEAAGEDHEPRRTGAGLRREEDPGLLPSAQRMGVR